VRAVNPLRADWELMRPTLLPSLLKIVAENRKHAERVAIFETARTYQPVGRDELPDERRAVTLALCGVREPTAWYRGDTEELDYFDARGAVEALLERLGGREVAFVPVEHPTFQQGRAAAVSLGGVQIGVVGEVHPRVAERFDVPGRVAVAEVDLEAFVPTLLETWSVQPVSRFQPIRQDFAIVVPESTAAADVHAVIAQAAFPLATDVTLFDIYRGAGVAEDSKSLAFSVTLSARDRQLGEHEIERIRNQIQKGLRRVNGALRT
jgi:phenylalanyl-tRNA synthetase beta chain